MSITGQGRFPDDKSGRKIYNVSMADYSTHGTLDLEGKVSAFLSSRQLLKGVSRLGVAVSGGPDSVALLLILEALLRKTEIRLFPIHLNHGLRKESASEALFVRTLVERLRLPLFYSEARLGEKKKVSGLSIEMAARTARSEFYDSAAGRLKLDALATGHHMNDLAETFLLRLARGAGLSGLTALRPKTSHPDYAIIRPLLCLSSHEIREWLAGKGEKWCEDASNRDQSIPRNRIRHTLLPLLEENLTPAFVQLVYQSCEILYQDDLYLESVVRAKLDHLGTRTPCLLPIDGIRGENPALQRRILREWLFRNGFEEVPYERIEALVKVCRNPGRKSARIEFPSSRSVLAEGGFLRCLSLPPPIPAPVRLELPGLTLWGEWRIRAEEAVGWTPSPECGIGSSQVRCFLSREACLGQTLLVRSRQSGDRIKPTGMKGAKKVQDILVDSKLPASLRDRIPLIATPSEIIYLPGYRVSRSFALPSQEAPSYCLFFNKK